MRFLLLMLMFSCSLYAEDATTIVPENEQISDFQARFELARILSHKKVNYEEALKQYQILLALQPANLEVIQELGFLYIHMKQYQAGLNLLYRGLNLYPNNVKMVVAVAQGETIVGHAEKANLLFKKALALSCDSKTLLEYADAAMSWGDFYKAIEIYREQKSQLRLGKALMAADLNEEAQEVLSPFPEEMIELKIHEKDFSKALSLASESPVLGTILYLETRYVEAIDCLEKIKDDSKYGVKALITIGKSYKKLNNEEKAHDAFCEAYLKENDDIEALYYSLGDQVLELDFLYSLSLSFDTLDLLTWSDLYSQNGYLAYSIYLHREILQIDPEIFPASIGLAENLSALNYHGAALEVYEALLQAFPCNSKLIKAIARNLSWSKSYESAIERYNELLQLNPEDPTVYREKARTYLWSFQFKKAMQTYNDYPFEGREHDILIQKSLSLEKRAKALFWDKRYIHALSAYEELLDFNPGNEEALFDYGQIYCILGLCDDSTDVYAHILNLDPGHTLVQYAMSRNELLTHPALNNQFSYWREIGSGTFSQSQIARYRFDTIAAFPLTCRAVLRVSQSEYVENPFYNFKFYPAQGQSVEADYTINEQLKAVVSASYKTYFGKFKSTVTSKNLLIYDACDYLKVILSCNKEDEIYNYFSLKQKTQSINSYVTLYSNLTNYWNASTTYQFYRYNDHNNQQHVNIATEYQLTYDPTVWKIILQGNYRNAQHQSISIVNGTTLVDVIHPYWTPDRYFSGSATLEFRHDLRQFVFCGAPERYFDIKITGESDNVNNPSIEAIVEWRYDFDEHLGTSLKGMIHRSNQWNAEGFWGTLFYRF